MKKIAVSIIVLIAIGVGIFLIISYWKPAPEVLSSKKESELLTEQTVPELAEIKKIKRDIITEVEDGIVKYQEESLYSEDDFAVILENKDEFKSQLIEKFKKEITGVTAENCKVDLDQSKKSTLLKCNIIGARYGTNSYNMHFLLQGTKRFGFDLYGFREIGKKFVYEGEINSIPTSIVFKFPYEFGHCHEHVWPR